MDRAGFEFILPIARWKGFGGEMDVRTLCFETFTFAAAHARGVRKAGPHCRHRPLLYTLSTLLV